MERYLRLQTDSSTQPGHTRVKPLNAEFDLYSGYPEKIRFLPVFHSNLAVFYQDIREKISFLENFFDEGTKNYSSVNIYYYSIIEDDEEKDLIKDTIKTSVTKFIDYSWGIDQFVKDWTELKEEIVADREKKNIYEAFNRKLNLVVFDIPKTTTDVYKQLYKLVKSSRRERIFIILLSSSGNNVPRVFHEIFDLAIYLGRDNQIICDYVHSDLGYGPYDIHQKHIGTAFESGKGFLLPIHPIQYKQSRYGKEQERILNKEYDDYLKFLETLE